MNLTALLSFYDERPEQLVSCIVGLQALGVPKLVALDGRYSLYPGDSASSDPNQHAAITLACRELGIDLTLRVPAREWEGDEVEKRTALFALGLAVSEPGDWFCVMDADQTPDMDTLLPDLHEQLESTEHDVAEVTFRDIPAVMANNPNWPQSFKVPIFYRAQKITLETNHYTYIGERGQCLWDGGSGGGQEADRLDLTSLVINHAPHQREWERQQDKAQYYALRDESAIEFKNCKCGAPAVRKMETNWRMSDIGPIADVTACCDRCAKRVDKQNARQLRAIGIQPESVVAAQRYGPAPDRRREAA